MWGAAQAQDSEQRALQVSKAKTQTLGRSFCLDFRVCVVMFFCLFVIIFVWRGGGGSGWAGGGGGGGLFPRKRVV